MILTIGAGQRGDVEGAGRRKTSDERVDQEVVSGVLNTLRNGGYGAVTINGTAYVREPPSPTRVYQEIGSKFRSSTSMILGWSNGRGA
jgi:hypothetical protein